MRRRRASDRRARTSPLRERATRKRLAEKSSVRRVADGAAEVEHRRQAIVRTAAHRIVEGAALGPKDALERLPREIADVAYQTELAVETRPELVQRREQRPSCIFPVDVGLDLGARAAVFRLEHEELDEPAAVRGRLERTSNDEADAASLFTRPCQILPRARRNEGFDGARLGADAEALSLVLLFVVLGGVPSAFPRGRPERDARERARRHHRLLREELRERNAFSVDLRKAVHQRREPQAQSTSVVRNSKRE